MCDAGPTRSVIAAVWCVVALASPALSQRRPRGRLKPSGTRKGAREGCGEFGGSVSSRHDQEPSQDSDCETDRLAAGPPPQKGKDHNGGAHLDGPDE